MIAVFVDRYYFRGLHTLPGFLPYGDDRGPQLVGKATGLPLFLWHEQCGVMEFAASDFTAVGRQALVPG